MKVQLKHLRTMKVKLERAEGVLNRTKQKIVELQNNASVEQKLVEQAARQLDRVSDCWQAGKDLPDGEAAQFGFSGPQMPEPVKVNVA